MTSPLDEHRAEIFEALLDSIVNADAEAFEAFNVEWERSRPEGSTDYIFPGNPRFYRLAGTCGHCGETWSSTSTTFDEESSEEDVQLNLAAMSQQLHMVRDCPAIDSCWCFVEVDEDEMMPICQECQQIEAFCGCEDGPALGPCMYMAVTVEKR